MPIRRLPPAALILAALASCGTPGHNSPSANAGNTPRSSFIRTCTENAAAWQMGSGQAASVCACTYDRVSSRYGGNWLMQPANANTPLGRYFIRSVRQCAGRTAADTGNRRNTRSAFLELCTARNADVIPNPAQARRVCACTYDTLRSRYTPAQWQRFIDTDHDPERDPVFKRRMQEAAYTCVRRHRAY